MSTSIDRAFSPSTSRRQWTIKLPPVRGEQLQILADVWGITVADAVGVMLRQQVKAGVLPADLPGVTCVRKGESMILGFEGGASVKMSHRNARHVAMAIRARAGLREVEMRTFAFLEAPDPSLSQSQVTIDRRGTGVNVTINDCRKSFSLSLAAELADLIDQRLDEVFELPVGQTDDTFFYDRRNTGEMILMQPFQQNDEELIRIERARVIAEQLKTQEQDLIDQVQLELDKIFQDALAGSLAENVCSEKIEDGYNAPISAVRNPDFQDDATKFNHPHRRDGDILDADTIRMLEQDITLAEMSGGAIFAQATPATATSTNSYPIQPESGQEESARRSPAIWTYKKPPGSYEYPPAALVLGLDERELALHLGMWMKNNKRKLPAAVKVYAGVLGGTSPQQSDYDDQCAQQRDYSLWLASCSDMQRRILSFASREKKKVAKAAARAGYAKLKAAQGNGPVREYVTGLSDEERKEREKVQEREKKQRYRARLALAGESKSCAAANSSPA